MVELTDTEFQMLYLFLKYPNKIFSIQNLYESVWEEPFFPSCGNTVMVHIRRLRMKIEADPRKPVLIQTVWGNGIVLAENIENRSDLLNEKYKTSKNSSGYSFRMAKLLICALALGASVFLLFSLIGGKLLHSYIQNSDYLYSMETHRIYTMTNWIRDNHISTSDTEKLNAWMDEQGLSSMTIERDGTLLFSRIAEQSFSSTAASQLQSFLEEAAQQKQEMKLAQQNLVLGMAHDLRTPLATLLTDLELLKRQETKIDQLNYADRALTKTLEIRALSDQLFEYFLASSDQPVELEPWESAEYALGDYLSELYLYLSQDGFQIQTGELFAEETKVRIHVEYMSRIINNIFSNIQKYADRSAPVILSTEITDDMLIISCKNKIAPASTHSGTGIGVKNIALMMQKMNGKQEHCSTHGWYEILLYFPCKRT